MQQESVDICYELKKISNLLARYIRKNSLTYGNEKITKSQAQILEYIFEKTQSHEKVYQKDIEANFSIRRSTATECLKRIEAQNMIVRKVSEEDARLKEIILTNKAKTCITNIHSHLQSLAKTVGEGITEEEINTLRKIILKLENNLKQQELLHE